MSQLPIFPPDSQRIDEIRMLNGLPPKTEWGKAEQRRLTPTTHTKVLRQKPNPSITLT